jgi:predicted MFS family arabinose efflux permease
LYLRFNDDPIVSNMKKKPTNPIRFIGRFFSQPRLTLAWFLAIGRSSWWSMFFIYASIIVVESGMGETFSGFIVSIGISFVFLVPVWGKIVTLWGIRRLLTIGYIGAGIFAFSISFMSVSPWVAIGLLISAAFAASMIYGAGNILFLRSVHPHERPEMTAVFMTYRDFGQLAPPAVFSIVLRSFELSAVFFAVGIGMLALAGLSRSIPKRL